MSETPTQTPPRSARPGRRWLFTAALATVAILGAAAVGARVASHGSPTTVTLQTVGGLPTVPPSPSAGSSAPTVLPYLRSTVTAPFGEAATGKRLELTVLEVKAPDPRCVTHELRPTGAFQPFVGVYYTGCSDWDRAGVHIALFAVRLRNRTDRAVTWDRARFAVLDRHGRRRTAIEVRTKAQDPGSLLAAKGRVGAHTTVEGLIAIPFDAAWTPGRLIYRDGSQRLLIELAGPVRRVGRS